MLGRSLAMGGLAFLMLLLVASMFGGGFVAFIALAWRMLAAFLLGFARAQGLIAPGDGDRLSSSAACSP
ncbi:MAG: hypothetical protein HC850_03235 [Rhodomicrobium sp.]|nr:hypothetical protein [Rhodomicrobium sp.]